MKDYCRAKFCTQKRTDCSREQHALLMDWSSKAVVPPETTTYAHLGAESSAGDAVAATYRYVDENEADFMARSMTAFGAITSAACSVRSAVRVGLCGT